MVGAQRKVKRGYWNRYRKVVGVLIKYGFEDLVAHPPFNRFRKITSKLAPFRDGQSVLNYTRYERIRLVCEELGTTYIKFAQIASNRPDILPEELIHEITHFQDQVLPISENEIRKVLTATYQRPLKELFEHIDYSPIASASIAQVHRARTIGGKEVVLKIQRPDITDTIEADIAILKNLASIIEHYFPQYTVFQPMNLVKMFETSIRKELKFTAEAANILRFQEQFADYKDIYVPSVYPEYTSNTVLCMEYIDGMKITELEAIEKATGLTGKELALKGIELYFEQVFQHGFFHADPHPGNIFVLKDTGQICFIDFGMMGYVLPRDQETMAKLLLALANKDVQDLKKVFIKFTPEGKLINESELEQDIVEFFGEYSNVSIERIEGDEILKGLNAMFFDYKIRVPANLLLLLKAMIIIEGVGLEIDPKYNIVKNIEPYTDRLIMRKITPEKLKQNVMKSFTDLSGLLSTLPEEIKDVLHKLRLGKLHMEFEHKGLEALYHKMEVISNRISFTMLLSALILGSSLMTIANVPPYIYNISLIGFVGFVVSGLLALRLIYSIIKHGNF